MTVTGAQWLESRERAAGSRRRRSDRVAGSGQVPPPCNRSLAVGFCILPEGHGAACVPLPPTYPPTPTLFVGGAA